LEKDELEVALKSSRMASKMSPDDSQIQIKVPSSNSDVSQNLKAIFTLQVMPQESC